MSLKDVLKYEKVSQLDLTGCSRIASGATVAEAVTLMREEGRNACLIVDGTRLVGIFTARDLVRRVMAEPDRLSRPIDDVMTKDPITATAATSVADAFWRMNDIGIRDLPVVDGSGGVRGNMTHRSVLRFVADQYPSVVVNLPPRPNRFPRKAEGG